MFKKIFLFTIFLMFCANVYAAEEAGQNPDPLNYETRKAWKTLNEFWMYGGFFFGDSLGNSFVAGGECTFNILKFLGIGTAFNYSRAKFSKNIDLNTPGFFQNKNVYTVDATATVSMPAAVKSGKKATEAELFLNFGAGATSINSSWEPHGFIGGGMKMFLFKPWFALRTDLRTSMHSIKKSDGTKKFDQDLDLLLGFSVQIPPRTK